ncbi:MAG TPA: hypothetical protein VG890_09560 [Puia sp.]|nr:hypothetical protein [Puia sp.]
MSSLNKKIWQRYYAAMPIRTAALKPMPRYLITGLIFLLTFEGIRAQPYTMRADSLKPWLCRTWEINYVLMGAAKVLRSPSAPNLVYQFRSDQTYIFDPGDPENRLTGKWNFDAKKKVIHLVPDKPVKNKSQIIVSVLPNEMIMLTNAKNPDNPNNMRMVFRVRSE